MLSNPTVTLHRIADRLVNGKTKISRKVIPSKTTSSGQRPTRNKEEDWNRFGYINTITDSSSSALASTVCSLCCLLCVCCVADCCILFDRSIIEQHTPF